MLRPPAAQAALRGRRHPAAKEPAESVFTFRTTRNVALPTFTDKKAATIAGGQRGRRGEARPRRAGSLHADVVSAARALDASRRKMMPYDTTPHDM